MVKKKILIGSIPFNLYFDKWDLKVETNLIRAAYICPTSEANTEYTDELKEKILREARSLIITQIRALQRTLKSLEDGSAEILELE
jgi:hypothetical protein